MEAEKTRELNTTELEEAKKRAQECQEMVQNYEALLKNKLDEAVESKQLEYLRRREIEWELNQVRKDKFIHI